MASKAASIASASSDGDIASSFSGDTSKNICDFIFSGCLSMGSFMVYLLSLPSTIYMSKVEGFVASNLKKFFATKNMY